MSDGRNKLNDFSLLKSLVGNSSSKNKKNNFDSRKQDKSIHTNAKRNKKSFQKKSTPSQKTKLRIPQYRQKQTDLSAQLPLKKSENTTEEIVVYINVEKQKLKDESLLFAWLCQRFPKCFNPKDKRPLKIGISDDIEKIYQNEYLVPVDQSILHNVIKRYVGDTRYQRAVIEHKKRFDLTGKAVEHFSDEHVEYAQKRLAEIAEKAKLRAQGIDIKTYYQQKSGVNTEKVSSQYTEPSKSQTLEDNDIKSSVKNTDKTASTSQQINE